MMKPSQLTWTASNENIPRRFIDVNIFVTSWTLDVILTFAEHGLFAPYWSNYVETEANQAMHKVHADSLTKPESIFRMANESFPFASIMLEEDDIMAVNLPDPNDRHVVSGAITSGSDQIITYNVKDFPASSLAPFGLVAVHPDQFLLNLAQNDPERVVTGLRHLVASKTNPPRSLESELAELNRNRLTCFCRYISRLLNDTKK